MGRVGLPEDNKAMNLEEAEKHPKIEPMATNFL
jgi:hypothetical protein